MAPGQTDTSVNRLLDSSPIFHHKERWRKSQAEEVGHEVIVWPGMTKFRRSEPLTTEPSGIKPVNLTPPFLLRSLRTTLTGGPPRVSAADQSSFNLPEDVIESLIESRIPILHLDITGLRKHYLWNPGDPQQWPQGSHILRNRLSRDCDVKIDVIAYPKTEPSDQHNTTATFEVDGNPDKCALRVSLHKPFLIPDRGRCFGKQGPLTPHKDRKEPDLYVIFTFVFNKAGPASFEECDELREFIYDEVSRSGRQQSFSFQMRYCIWMKTLKVQPYPDTMVASGSLCQSSQEASMKRSPTYLHLMTDVKWYKPPTRGTVLETYNRMIRDQGGFVPQILPTAKTQKVNIQYVFLIGRGSKGDSSNNWVCPLCTTRRFNMLATILSHLKTYHLFPRVECDFLESTEESVSARVLITAVPQQPNVDEAGQPTTNRSTSYLRQERGKTVTQERVSERASLVSQVPPQPVNAPPSQLGANCRVDSSKRKGVSTLQREEEGNGSSVEKLDLAREKQAERDERVERSPHALQDTRASNARGQITMVNRFHIGNMRSESNTCTERVKVVQPRRLDEHEDLNVDDEDAGHDEQGEINEHAEINGHAVINERIERDEHLERKKRIERDKLADRAESGGRELRPKLKKRKVDNSKSLKKLLNLRAHKETVIEEDGSLSNNSEATSGTRSLVETNAQPSKQDVVSSKRLASTALRAHAEKERIKHPVPSGPNGVNFFRSTTKRVLQAGEEISDSEDDVDDTWVKMRREEAIEKLARLTLKEKAFVRMFNRHFCDENVRGDKYFPEALYRFTLAYLDVLQDPPMLAEFLKKMALLKLDGLVSTQQINECLEAIRSRDPSAGSRGLLGYAEKPIEAQKKWTETCSCGREVADFSEAVICSKEDCQNPDYHLKCVGLDKPPTRWLCETCTNPR